MSIEEPNQYCLYVSDSILNGDSEKELLIAVYNSEEEAILNRQKVIDNCQKYNIEDCDKKIIVKPFISKQTDI